MRKTPVPTKRVLEPHPPKQKRKDPEPKTIIVREVPRLHGRTPSKSPSLQPYSRSISRQTISARLSFNKNKSRLKYDSSSDVINTKEQTFITHQESSNRSVACGDDVEGPRNGARSSGKVMYRKVYPQKSFFNSLESRNQGRSTPRVSHKKKVKNKNTVILDSKAKQDRSEKTKKHKKPRKSSEKSTPRPPLKEKPSLLENRDQLVEHHNLRYQKKITQVSQQQLECSIGKPMRMGDKCSNPKQTSKLTEFFNTPKKEPADPHNEAIMQLIQSIKVKVSQTMPGLSNQQRGLLTAVMFIQRAWRQKRVKRIIKGYLAPRAYTPRPDLVSDSSIITSNQSTPYKLQIPKCSDSPKTHLFQPQQSKKTQEVKQKKDRYVDCFMTDHFYRGNTKKTPFLQMGDSLSQKYFMDKLQRQIHPQQTKVDRIKEAKNRLLLNRVSPHVEMVSPASPLKQPLSDQTPNPSSQSKIVAQQILDYLIDHIPELSVDESSRKKQREKDSALPRIKTSRNTIDKYLSGLIKHLDSCYFKQVIIDNLNKPLGIKPADLLRYIRASDDDEEEMQINLDSEEGEFSSGSVLPVEVFLQYQQILEQTDQVPQQKYKNFLEGIQRVYNKSLIDCFSEVLDEMRVYGLVGKPFPWQKAFLNNSLPVKNDKFMNKMSTAKTTVLKFASFKLGSKRNNNEASLLSCIQQEYGRAEPQWCRLDQQILEINLAISSYVADYLVEEFCSSFQHQFNKGPW